MSILTNVVEVAIEDIMWMFMFINGVFKYRKNKLTNTFALTDYFRVDVVAWHKNVHDSHQTSPPQHCQIVRKQRNKRNID